MQTSKNKRSLVLAICFALAGLFWLLLNLSSNYEDNVKFPVEYVNWPEDIEIISTPPPFITLRIASKGWNLLILHLTKPFESLTIDLSKTENIDRIPLQNYLTDFNEELDAKYSIVGISPAFVSIESELSRRKLVPLKLSFIKDLPDKFDFVGDPILTPDSILLTGPGNLIDTIYFWKTEKTRIEKRENIVSKRILLKASDKIRTSEESVLMSVSISSYEKVTIDNLAIEIPECQSGGDLMIFPNNGSVSFSIPSEMKSSFNSSDLILQVNCDDIADIKDNYLQVNLKTELNFIKDVTVSPDFVEFKLYK
ncbi:MAG: hypothetical protein HKN22_05760 [Bacteroidia bacterium]|nr:hypothetical protein [Bacteroidia bacterium]